MKKKETSISGGGRREFLKAAGILLAGTLAAGFRSAGPGPVASEKPGAAGTTNAPGDGLPVRGLSELEAAYYRPLFDSGRDLAG